jgi:hypothetical protein
MGGSGSPDPPIDILAKRWRPVSRASRVINRHGSAVYALRKLLAGVRIPGWKLGNQRWTLGNQRWMLGNQRWTLGNQRWTLGNQRWTLGNQRWKPGNQRWTLGSCPNSVWVL